MIAPTDLLRYWHASLADRQLLSLPDRVREVDWEAIQSGRVAIARAEVLDRARIHNKTLAVDESWIVEGSFNWLSAVRDPTLPYARMERSLRYQGPDAGDFVKDAWREVVGVGP